jgi:AraC-like DNA-binding protein
VLSYVERRPSPPLREHLECLWAVWDDRPRPRREPERVVPDACPELIVHLADPFSRLVGGRWRVQPRVFLAGTLTRPWLLRAGRRVRTFGIRFRPGAAPRLLPVAMRQATDAETELSRIVGPAASADLVARFGRPGPRAARFRAAESWLLERLGLGRRPGRSTAAVARILATRGQARIIDVAKQLGTTARSLERAFAAELGIRPKLFARIVRLNAVLARLGEEDRQRAVDLALDAGYFDQPHLLRDFRSLAGRPVRSGSAADGELARHFTHPERLAVLLRGD